MSDRSRPIAPRGVEGVASGELARPAAAGRFPVRVRARYVRLPRRRPAVLGRTSPPMPKQLMAPDG